MLDKEQVVTALISLKVEDKTSLFILLCADGTINRQGVGSATRFEGDLFIGRTQEPLFEEFMRSVENEMFQHAGLYDVPDKVGERCHLKILLESKEEMSGWEFIYGAQSQGPPEEITHMVKEAVRLTDPWFRAQQEMVGKSGMASVNPPTADKEPNKPKWKFWR